VNSRIPYAGMRPRAAHLRVDSNLQALYFLVFYYVLTPVSYYEYTPFKHN